MSDRLVVPAGPGDIEAVRILFLEYQAALGLSPCFQGFDKELAALPGAYAAPRGALLLLKEGETMAGCAALRPLPGGEVGEMKRLYVRPAARGCGGGRRLAAALIETARRAGYARLVLETMERMTEARALYASLGFREVPAYYDDPLPGVRCCALELGAAGESNERARTG